MIDTKKNPFEEPFECLLHTVSNTRHSMALHCMASHEHLWSFDDTPSHFSTLAFKFSEQASSNDVQDETTRGIGKAVVQQDLELRHGTRLITGPTFPFHTLFSCPLPASLFETSVCNLPARSHR